MVVKLFKKNYRHIISLSIGVAAGIIYYKLIGCNSGSCAITSNPYISAFFGGALGLSFTL